MPLKHSLIVATCTLCLTLGVSGFALAKGAQSPYDTIYEVIADTSLRVAPEAGSKVKVPLDKGTKGVVMRWCRGEFNFRSWAYGSLSQRRAMLKERVCEVQVNGTIGFVDAKYLDPM